MQKSLFLLIPLLLWGCEKTFDNIVDVSTDNFQVTSATQNKASYDLKNPGDSILTARIGFTRLSQIQQVFFNVIASDNSILNSSPVEMFDISNNLFSASFELKREFPNGRYTLNFIAKGTSGETKLVATSSFNFNNGQDNVPPVVSNLMMADSVQAGGTILFTVEASDSNGLSDIEFVFYETFDPNGVQIVNTSGVSQFPMFDDGNTSENGDVTAGDGIFTVVLTFPTTALRGTWRFEFRARDRSKELSNTIIHNIVVF
ncbi:MAG: hypothetical protein HKP17_08915 [Ignavibacteriaceae bacterium]|nr:hypothetical protein [Ignavibacteriaceae bacterium]